LLPLPSLRKTLRTVRVVTYSWRATYRLPPSLDKQIPCAKPLPRAFIRSNATVPRAEEHIIGIDLGTTYSCVGVFKDGRVEIIPNDQGNRITPSYVAWDGDERLVGDAAKNQATINPSNTVFDVKRLIGRNYQDETVQADIKLWPYKVVNKENKPFIEVSLKTEKKQFAPEEVSAMILSYLRKTAETYLGEAVNSAVITVPAYFNDAQVRAECAEGGERLTQTRGLLHLFSRLLSPAAPGDQGCRHHLRHDRQAHHQRADGRRDRVRSRQEGRRARDPRF
jgi:hypothetical protein